MEINTLINVPMVWNLSWLLTQWQLWASRNFEKATKFKSYPMWVSGSSPDSRTGAAAGKLGNVRMSTVYSTSKFRTLHSGSLLKFVWNLPGKTLSGRALQKYSGALLTHHVWNPSPSIRTPAMYVMYRQWKIIWVNSQFRITFRVNWILLFFRVLQLSTTPLAELVAQIQI